MRIPLSRLIALALCSPLLAAPVAARDDGALPDWENARVFAINREPAHATFVPYPDETAARRAGGVISGGASGGGPRAASPFVRSRSRIDQRKFSG